MILKFIDIQYGDRANLCNFMMRNLYSSSRGGTEPVENEYFLKIRNAMSVFTHIVYADHESEIRIEISQFSVSPEPFENETVMTRNDKILKNHEKLQFFSLKQLLECVHTIK